MGVGVDESRAAAAESSRTAVSPSSRPQRWSWYSQTTALSYGFGSPSFLFASKVAMRQRQVFWMLPLGPCQRRFGPGSCSPQSMSSAPPPSCSRTTSAPQVREDLADPGGLRLHPSPYRLPFPPPPSATMFFVGGRSSRPDNQGPDLRAHLLDPRKLLDARTFDIAAPSMSYARMPW